MFEKLKAKIKQLQDSQKQQYAIDSSQFNDPIADKTEWWPMKPGGSSFKSHNLKKISSSQMKYQLSGGGIAFLSLFGGVGIIVAIIGLVLLINSESTGFFLVLFGSIFTVIAIFMYKFMAKPILFDATMGFIWSGKNPPKFAGVNHANENLIYFNSIHAIQIISERVRSNKSTFTSYEINLVLKDGTRFNVVDHGKHSQILIDAEDLSAFIGKPVWDVS